MTKDLGEAAAFLAGVLLWPSLLLAATSPVAPPPHWGAAPTSPCPLDFTFVRRLPWDPSCCHASQAKSNNTCCCQAIRSLLGISLSLRLETTSLFSVRDLPTSAACLSSLQSVLTSSFSVHTSAVRECYPSDFLLVRNDTCAGILTLHDWDQRIGRHTAVDTSCRSVVNNDPTCNACIGAVVIVASQLLRFDGNGVPAREYCFYYTVVYAAGIASRVPPTDRSNVQCIFGLPLRNTSKMATAVSSGNERKNRDLLFTSAILAAVLLLAFAAFAMHIRFGRRRRLNRGGSWRPKTGATLYSIDELRKATGEFSESSLLGRGGFGLVYKGELADGDIVAVKKILKSRDANGDAELENEVDIISNLRHRNLVSLRGCCVTADADGGGKQWHLVYEYMPNGSLHDHLFQAEDRKPLTWEQRRSIVLDIARGVAYLHHGIKPAIIHRDLKPNNILLDEEMRAAVADFGLAKQRDCGTITYGPTTRIAGTHGYLAPEYALYGHLSSKVDVYSFGVMVLEIMSGRRAVDASSVLGEEPVVVAEWAREMMRAGKAADVVERRLLEGADAGAVADMERFVKVGSLCAHLRVAMRPTMAEALKMLEGDIDVPAVANVSWPVQIGTSVFSI